MTPRDCWTRPKEPNNGPSPFWPAPIRSTDTDLARALEAMTAPELRAFVRAVLDEFEDEQRGRVIDSLMTRAARGDAGWKPNRPSSRIVNDARSFADAAQQVARRSGRRE